ncbi:MAG: hypothetical protein K2X35_16835 [Bryobacteraceae bacterium]|nr:hypothetical protein [Bryobacteraceae bacterium]
MNAWNRRSFLRQASAMIAAHAAIPAWAQTTPNPQTAPVEFRTIRLQSIRLDEQAAFYSNTLGLPVRQQDGGLKVTAGRTVLEFSPAPPASQPFYHFAFNIPENQLEDSMKWLRPRCPILPRPNGAGEIYHFANWNAHSCYFLDAAGNLLEFIARHTLPNASRSGFDSGSLLSVSEIGLVTDSVPGIAERLKSSFAVQNYFNGSDEFMPMGNEHGLFILVKRGRAWGIVSRPAEVYPVEVRLAGGSRRSLKLDPLPYRVESGG